MEMSEVLSEPQKYGLSGYQWQEQIAAIRDNGRSALDKRALVVADKNRAGQDRGSRKPRVDGFIKSDDNRGYTHTPAPINHAAGFMGNTGAGGQSAGKGLSCRQSICDIYAWQGQARVAQLDGIGNCSALRGYLGATSA